MASQTGQGSCPSPVSIAQKLACARLTWLGTPNGFEHGDGLGVPIEGGLCLTAVPQQAAQVDVTPGQLLAVAGYGGEVSSQTLVDAEGSAVGNFRLGPLAQVPQQGAQVAVARG